MTRSIRLRATLSLLVTLALAPALSRADTNPCGPQLLREVPARPAAAVAGSGFVSDVQHLAGLERDARVRAELLEGNLPDFLRHLVPVTLRSSGSPHTIVACVLPDYLAVGGDRDFVFVPMGLGAALDIARRFGFELPTRRLVDAIYDQSPVKLAPEPLPPGAQMSSTDYFARHARLIETQRAARSAPTGELTAGHKKDLVLTRRLWDVPGRVAIYGWHRASSAPIQPLSTVHGERYADYSHGVRLVSDTLFVDGQPRSMTQVLAEPALAALLSDEGPLPQARQRLASLLADVVARDSARR